MCFRQWYGNNGLKCIWRTFKLWNNGPDIFIYIYVLVFVYGRENENLRDNNVICEESFFGLRLLY